MKQKILLLLILTGSVAVMFSSCATKKMVKQAEKFETAGMFGEASELYYRAHVKKPDKADITIALKRSGRLYLEELSQRVDASFDKGNYKETVYHFLEARNLIDRLKKAGIYLEPDKTMVQQFDDAKAIYLAKRYEEGQKLLYDLDYDDAKNVFNEIYNIDPDYKNTRNYLNQATFEPVYKEGSAFYDDGKYMEAYRKWEYIYNAAGNYKEVKERMNDALNERYKQGVLLLAHEQFDEAASALGDVYRENPDFRDVNTLFTEARNEPVYRKAVEMLNAGKCRSAYYACEQIIGDAGSYKDVDKIHEQALACAQYPVAVQTPALRKNSTRAKDFLSLLNSRLLKLNNPFLKIYMLSSVDSRIDQSMRQAAGSVNKAALKSLYDQHKIKAVLSLDFSRFDAKSGKEQRTQKTGFERVVMKSTTGETTFYDKQVKYSEISKENTVNAVVTYKLISTETGEILLSDRVAAGKSDEIKYVSYSGNPVNLYPAVNHNGTYSLNDGGYKKLQRLLKASHEITPVNELVNATFKEITQRIADDINNFNPEK